MLRKNKYKTQPPSDRFWAKVVKIEGGCGIWTGYRSPYGYGRFGVGSKIDGTRKVVEAYRWSYEQSCGPVPAGMTLDHLCKNPPCVNPSHLEVVTRRINTLRGTALPALNAIKTHCLRGHPFNEINTRINEKGNRRCRTCAREFSAARGKERRRKMA